MAFRTRDTYSVPGKGTYNTKRKTFSGKGGSPPGYKKVREPTAATTPTTTVSSSGDTTTTGFSSQRGARRARRRSAASRRRVRAIARSVERTREKASPPTAATSSKPYEAPPRPASKPPRFQGKPTAGTPTYAELTKAQKAGTLEVNRKGFVTTPKVRKTAGTIKRIQKRAQKRQSRTPLPGLDREQAKVARTVLRRGEKARAVPKEKLAAIETGLVESSLRNLPYGDADSEGFRQERTSIYGTGPQGPRNVKAASDRLYHELRTDPGTSTAPTPGRLAQAAQGSAFPERYDEREGEARAIISAYNKGKLKPGESKKLAKAKKQARKLGLKIGEKQGGTTKLPGPYDGSRAMVRKIVGSKVRGDKETGHSPTGDHDPSQPNSYAQDINLAIGNPSEKEPAFTQRTVDRMAANLRKMGAKVPKLTLGEDNWEGTVNGYRIQFLTIPHGSGPHIHIGARWTGESTGGISFGTSEVNAYAQATGQSIASVERKLRKGKLTGLQILKRLEKLGVGVGLAGEAKPVSSDSDSPTLRDLERKYL